MVLANALYKSYHEMDANYDPKEGKIPLYPQQHTHKT